jgi:mannosyltransferase
MNREEAKWARRAQGFGQQCLAVLRGLGTSALDAGFSFQRKAFDQLGIGLRTLTLEHKLLAGLVVVGAGLRLYMLADKSIWLDEAFSITISQRGLLDVLRMVVRTDTHPPLYYLLLKVWMVLGEGEARVRLLSTLFSIAAIPVMYKVTQVLYEDRRVGLVGAAILAFSPFQVWYAQETRMYAMLTFLVLASAYFFLRALRYGERKDWVGYVITTVLALYTDNGAIWYVATITIFYLISVRRFRSSSRAWFTSQAAIGLIYLPWLPFFWRQTRQVTEAFWLPPPSFQTVLNTFLEFNSLNFPFIEISLLYMAMIFVWAYIIPKKDWQRRLVSLWLFVPLVISLLLSLRQPIFLSRNLIAASLGYYLLVAGTIGQFRNQRATLALLFPLVVMNLVSIGNNAWFKEKEDWRGIAASVAQDVEGKKDGLIIFQPGYGELPFNYYFKYYDIAVNTQGYPGDEILLHPQPREVEDLAAVIEGRPYIWLVRRSIESEEPDWTVKDWLDTHGYVRQEDVLRKDLVVMAYDRWDKAPPSQAVELPSGPSKSFLPVVYQGTSYQTYLVRPDETLLEVALRFETTVQELIDANDLQIPYDISEGQKLLVPIVTTDGSGDGNEQP